MTELLEWTTAGGVITLVGFMLYQNHHNTQKRARIYERIDEVKEDVIKKHVSKEVCSVVHEQLRSDVTEMKHDLKLLLHKNGIK